MLRPLFGNHFYTRHFMVLSIRASLKFEWIHTVFKTYSTFVFAAAANDIAYLLIETIIPSWWSLTSQIGGYTAHFVLRYRVGLSKPRRDRNGNTDPRGVLDWTNGHLQPEQVEIHTTIRCCLLTTCCVFGDGYRRRTKVHGSTIQPK